MSPSPVCDSKGALSNFPRLMNCSFYPFHWLFFDARGVLVNGEHAHTQLPIHRAIQADFDELLPSNRARILASPNGFEGPCAPLLQWTPAKKNEDMARLVIKTGFRPYTHSNTLKRLLASSRAWEHTQSSTFVAHETLQPLPSLSWGFSLTTVVLLSRNRILMGQRGANMDASPGRWSAVFTEIIEPKDISLSSMEPLLHRLVQEELPAFVNAGTHRFVGLLLLPESYTWTLVSVLDLRDVDGEHIETLVASLAPDEETQAWYTHDLNMPLEPSMLPNTQGLALVRDIVYRLK